MTEIAALNIKVETSQVKDASGALDKLTTSGRQAETATDRLQRSMLDLRGVVAGVASAFLAYKVGEYVKNSALLAARYETLGVVMTRAGKNAGYTAGQMDEMEAALKKQGIAGVEARESLTKMAASFMDLSKASDLARAAQNLGTAAGINSSEAFSRLTVAIQSGQVEMLRTMGLNVSFESGYKKTAAELHKNVAALTEHEKMLSRTNAVLAGSKGFMGLYEEAMTTAGKRLTSLDRYMKEFQVTMGTAFNPATVRIVDSIGDALKELEKNFKTDEMRAKIESFGNGIANFSSAVITDAVPAMTNFATVLGAFGTAWNSLPEPLRQVLIYAWLGKRFGPVGAAVGVVGGLYSQASAIGEKGARGLSYLVDSDYRRQANDQTNPDNISMSDERLAELRKMQDREDSLRRVSKGIYSTDFSVYGKDQGGTEQSQTATDKLRKAMEQASEARRDAVADILKHNAATESETVAVRDEIAVLEMLSTTYGDAHAESVAMYRAGAQASKEYQDQLANGVSIETAAANMAARMAKAQSDLNEARRKSAVSLASGFAGPAYDAQVKDLKALYNLSEESVTDRLALEADLTSKLRQMEIQRLMNTRTATGGMQAALLTYHDSATNAAENMNRVYTNAFGGMEDALVKFATTGKLEFSSLVESVIADIIRMQIRMNITAPLAQGIQSGGLMSWFKGLFNADGNAFGPAGMMAFANGGIVNSPTAFRFGAGGANLGIMGEAGPEAILPLKRGSDGKLGVQAQGNSTNGGTQTVTVIMKDSSGKQTAEPMKFDTSGMRNFVLNVVRDASERGVAGFGGNT